MSKFNAGQSFVDGDTVTGAKLNNITGLLDIYTGLISEQTAMVATVSTADQLLIADTDNGDSGAANRVTIQKLLNDTLTNGTYTNAQLSGNLSVTQLSTLGTLNNTRGTIGILNSTTGTIANLTSSTANITLGTIPTLTAGTTTSTAANITNGTVQTLTASTGTIGTFNSTTGTIATLNSTTGTIPTLVATTLITTGTGTAAAPAIVPTGDTNTGIFFPAADTIAFSDGGAESMRINSSGNVGIGMTPAFPLDISSATGNFRMQSTTGTNLCQAQLINGSATLRVGVETSAGGSIVGGSSSFSGVISNASNFPLAFGTNNTERLRIDSSGNVSIGTATALSKLHVHGDLTMSNATTAITASTSTITPPATVAGYLTVSINGTSRKIAFYAT